MVPIRRRVVCPKCRREPSTLIEHWADHTIAFDVADGMVDREGYLNMGNPEHVVALCECGHKWRVRGVRQITDITENGV